MYLSKKLKIYKSRIIDYEISNISYNDKKRKVELLRDGLNLEDIPYVEGIEKRVDELEKYNIHCVDAYHIAFAESKGIDYLLTVDKQLISASQKANLKVKVINPVQFIMEVF